MIRKTSHKNKIIKSFEDAQKIAFAPLTFQAVNAMLEFGILKAVDDKPCRKEDLINSLNLSEYTVHTLLEVAETIGIIEMQEGLFTITTLGQAFLYDEMTRVNFNFTKDVCFSGSKNLVNSFTQNLPCGLREMYPEAQTIYPHISKLPSQMRQSWYEFDHYYSDNCFDIIFRIIDTNKKVFDIGGNTGKFEKLCIKNKPDIDITMLDLPENIDFIKNNPELQSCSFYKTDILNKNSALPHFSGSVIMSQFLDCFSKEQIVFILKRIKEFSNKDTKIYILEPFIDKQKFAGAKYALVHTSLYFTCMANGCSKMYSQKDMAELISQAGLSISCEYDNLGAHDYTLLECVIND